MKNFALTWKDSLTSLGVLSAAFVVCLLLHNLPISDGLAGMVLVLAVFLISAVTEGYIYGVAASFLAVLIDNFAFTFPFFAFDFLTVENFISAIVMLIVAVMTCTLTTKIKIQQAIKAEAEKEKMRANLLRAVSHDLRTPLTTIYGACGILRENHDSFPRNKQLELLGQVQEDSENLIHMVENLLMITKANSDTVRLEKTETVLEELIDSTLIKFKKHYPEQTVTTSIPDDFISIPMDAMLIQQVIMNLLENAVVHAIGMTELTLTVTIKGKRAVFSISDNGCGIPKEREGNLFSGYGDSGELSADSRRAGMGIGLSVCASIIKAHGGEIWGGNRKSGGAEVCFALEMEEQTHEQQQIQDPGGRG